MLSLEVKVMNGLWRAKNTVGKAVHDFFVDEEGDTNLISIVLVLVIVLALAVVFRKNIANMVNSLWDSVNKDMETVTGSGFDTPDMSGTTGTTGTGTGN